MSDDLREREPQRDQGDFPPEEGIRSDNAGTGTGVTGPAPAGGDPESIARGPAGDPEPPGGMGATAGGGTGEGQDPAGDDPQTDWLREADGGAPSEQDA